MSFVLRIAREALQPRPRNAIAWIAAVLLSCAYVISAWHAEGHISCDFGGQWLLGRMIVERRGHELYQVAAQQEVLAGGYTGDGFKQMDDTILQKGSPEQVNAGVQGPLYPPTMALVMCPFAVLGPRAAHAVLVVLYVQMAILVGWLLKEITGGRLQAGEATLLLLVFPHFSMGLVLGQNHVLTLAILTLGWWLRARGWPLAGGLVWGLLAYKPVFAVAVLWVPFVVGSGRMFLGMAVSGLLFSLATLPVCGFDLFVISNEAIQLNREHPWGRWLVVGRDAAATYGHDGNWVWFSRDLLGLARRDMWNWDFVRDHLQASVSGDGFDPLTSQLVDTSERATHVGAGLMAGVIGVTVFLCAANAVGRRLVYRPMGERHFGPWPAFGLLGGLLTCYHFIWYDVLACALPVALFLADARRLSRPGRVGLGLILAGLFATTVNLAHGSGPLEFPIETFLLVLLWLWSGWRMLREPPAVDHDSNRDLNAPLSRLES